MFNAVRMDIYRLIHTKSAYVILVIAMALAIAMSGMTALVRSMAAESIVETTDDVTMVSESDSEIADEYEIQHQRNRQMDQRQQSGLKWMNPTCQMRCRP